MNLYQNLASANDYPVLTAKFKHDDHAMTWYDHGDPYSPWYDHDDSYSPGMIMVRSCHGHHEIKHYHGIAVMENSMIMPWWPWSLL